jgi:hypothetical protein
MWFHLGVLLCFFVVCSLIARCAPASAVGGQEDLRHSALRALRSVVWDLATPPTADSQPKARVSSTPVATCSARSPGAAKATFGLPQQRSPAPSGEKRARVTPYQAKRVAAAQDWRCGCGCVDPKDPQRRGVLLDETFEIDHRIPTRNGGAHDPSNWVAVLRSHHQLKSAIESQAAALRRK